MSNATLKDGPIFSKAIYAWAAVFTLFNTLLWQARLVANDWMSLWVAAHLVREGHSEHLYDHDPVNFSAMGGEVWPEVAQRLFADANLEGWYAHPYVHTPLVAYILSPFTSFVGVHASAVVVTILSSFMLVVLVASSYHLWFRRPIPFAWLAPITVVLSLSEPAQFTFVYGQTSLIIFGGLILALTASRRHPAVAGLLLAGVALVKLTPMAMIILLAIFPTRRRAAVWAAGATVLGFLASWIVAGTEVFKTWVESVQRISSWGLVNYNNFSLISLAKMDEHPDVLAGVWTIEDPAAVYGIVQFLVCATLAGAALVIAWRRKEGAFAFLAAEAVVISSLYASIVWTHYFVMIVVLYMAVLALRGPQWLRIGVPMIMVPFFFRPFTGFEQPVMWGVPLAVYTMIIIVMVLYALNGLQRSTLQTSNGDASRDLPGRHYAT